MSNYARGVRLEHKCRDFFIAQGYTVIRSAGSKGAADLVAISGNDVVLVQVGKKGKSVADALQRLAAVPAPAHVRKEVWIWVPRQGWRLASAAASL